MLASVGERVSGFPDGYIDPAISSTTTFSPSVQQILNSKVPPLEKVNAMAAVLVKQIKLSQVEQNWDRDDEKFNHRWSSKCRSWGRCIFKWVKRLSCEWYSNVLLADRTHIKAKKAGEKIGAMTERGNGNVPEVLIRYAHCTRSVNGLSSFLRKIKGPWRYPVGYFYRILFAGKRTCSLRRRRIYVCIHRFYFAFDIDWNIVEKDHLC